MYDKLRTRQLRRTYSEQGWALLIYYVILNAVVMTFMICDSLVQSAVAVFTGVIPDSMTMTERMIGNSGWGYIIAILAGLGLLLLWKEPTFCFKTIWQRGKPMKFGSFLAILAIFTSAQLGGHLLSMALEFLMNIFGFSATEALEGASLSMDSLSMFLYVGIGAPISEEILFRGLMLRSMQPYGKKFAIFASALIFGLYHANIIQTPFAFVVGLVMGYVAVEYNIGWAIVLHMFNNLILNDTMFRLFDHLPAPWNEYWLLIVIVASALIGGIVLIAKRRKIKLWLKMNPDDKFCARAFWTAPGILVLVFVLLGLTMFTIFSMFLTALTLP